MEKINNKCYSFTEKKLLFFSVLITLNTPVSFCYGAEHPTETSCPTVQTQATTSIDLSNRATSYSPQEQRHEQSLDSTTQPTPLPAHFDSQFINDSQHIKNLAIACVFGSCIDWFYALRVDFCGIFFWGCCGAITCVTGLIVNPIGAAYRCCTINSTYPRIRRNIDSAVHCEKVQLHLIGPKYCCNGEEGKKAINDQEVFDKQELITFKQWKVQKMQ